MDQILNNKWLLIGVVVSALVLAVGLTFYFRSGKTPSTTLEQQPTYESQQPSDAEYEDESAPQDTEGSRPPEAAEQSEGVVPA